MKKYLLIIILVSPPFALFADIYKYVAPDGKVYYSPEPKKEYKKIVTTNPGKLKNLKNTISFIDSIKHICPLLISLAGDTAWQRTKFMAITGFSQEYTYNIMLTDYGNQYTWAYPVGEKNMVHFIHQRKLNRIEAEAFFTEICKESNSFNDLEKKLASLGLYF